MDPHYRGKRMLDCFLASLCLVLLLPLYILIALLIWLTSGRPIIFKQERVGYGGKVFSIFKFRTMSVSSSEDTGEIVRDKNDPRITQVGKVLRKLHLDELPQFVNVVRGEMSMVGPRPHHLELYRELSMKVQGYTERIKVRPGVTGLSQLCGRKTIHDRGWLYEVHLDAQYRNTQCFWGDLKLIARTVPCMIFGLGI